MIAPRARAGRVALVILAGYCAFAVSGCGPGNASEVEARESERESVSARALVRVRVASVQRGHITYQASVSGMVYAFRKATVAAETEGRIVKRLAQPGDEIDANEPIVVLDATRLELAVSEAEAHVKARFVDLAEANRDYQRGEELAKSGTISDSRHDSKRFAVDRAESAAALAEVSLARAKRTLADATVRGPFPGTVEEVHVEIGDFVRPGTPIVTLVDLSKVRLRAGVTADEAGTLEVGGHAQVAFESLGGIESTGEIRSIGRVADRSTGTYLVELWIDNTDGLMREGMVAGVEFGDSSTGEYALVPRSALIREDGLVSLFVLEESGADTLARLRRVRVGRSNDVMVEILQGTELGEKVIVDGLFALRDGALVFVGSEVAAAPGT